MKTKNEEFVCLLTRQKTMVFYIPHDTVIAKNSENFNFWLIFHDFRFDNHSKYAQCKKNEQKFENTRFVICFVEWIDAFFGKRFRFYHFSVSPGGITNYKNNAFVASRFAKFAKLWKAVRIVRKNVVQSVCFFEKKQFWAFFIIFWNVLIRKT